MNVDPKLVLQAAEIMRAQPENTDFWQANGVYSLDAIRNIMDDQSVTPDDIEEALGEQPLRRPVVAAKEVPAAPTVTAEGVGLGVTAEVPTLKMAAVLSVSAADASPNVALAEIEDQIALDRKKVEDGLAARNVILAKAAASVTLTDQEQQAKIVKEVQAQTVASLTARKALNEKAEQILGIKKFASPLDQALASGGGKRSQVLRLDPVTGKSEVFVAGHTRSQESVRNLAQHLHQQTANRVRGQSS
jgi:hypothetical protein